MTRRSWIREASDERLGHPVSKVFLRWVSDRFFKGSTARDLILGRSRIPRAASGQDVSDGKQAEVPQPRPEQASGAPRWTRSVPRSPPVSRGSLPLAPSLPLPNALCGFCSQASARNPSVNGAPLVVHVAVDRHPLPLLPALDRGHIAAEVCRDFLPRIQPLFGRPLGRSCLWQRSVHRALRMNPQIAVQASNPIVTPPPGERQNAAFEGSRPLLFDHTRRHDRLWHARKTRNCRIEFLGHESARKLDTPCPPEKFSATQARNSHTWRFL